MEQNSTKIIIYPILHSIVFSNPLKVSFRNVKQSLTISVKKVHTSIDNHFSYHWKQKKIGSTTKSFSTFSQGSLSAVQASTSLLTRHIVDSNVQHLENTSYYLLFNISIGNLFQKKFVVSSFAILILRFFFDEALRWIFFLKNRKK